MAKLKKRPPESWTYILQSDRALPIEQQSRFVLSPLTHAERAAVRDGAARILHLEDGSVQSIDRTHQNAYAIVLDHVVSIENFPAGASQPWPAKRDDRMRYLEQLDDDDVLELGNEVWLRSSLGPDEASIKNSSPPEHTSSSGAPSLAMTPSIAAPPAPSVPS